MLRSPEKCVHLPEVRQLKCTGYIFKQRSFYININYLWSFMCLFISVTNWSFSIRLCVLLISTVFTL
uniref:Uncharacterized protein n=1 Tax=Anguilla anguilla TaxID=7936 RepID=A0A0E9UCQ4_ANGAN